MTGGTSREQSRRRSCRQAAELAAQWVADRVVADLADHAEVLREPDGTLKPYGSGMLRAADIAKMNRSAMVSRAVCEVLDKLNEGDL